MKLRTDYVSNSSSSSFILAGDKNSFTSKFKLKKQDFIDAIIDLSGGKEKYDEYVAKHKNKYWHGSWFEVYDKKVTKDMKHINSNATNYLKNWYSGIIYYDKIHQTVRKDHGHNMSKYMEAYDALREAYNLPWSYDFEAKTNYSSHYDSKTNRFITKAVPKHIDKTVRELHDFYGVMSNYDVLMCDFARFLFHFGDNDIYNLEGTMTASKNDELYENPTSDWEKQHNEEVKQSLYETESHSIQRVCEVLFNWFKSHGKLAGLKDETWNDLYNDVLAVTMHEG